MDKATLETRAAQMQQRVAELWNTYQQALGALAAFQALLAEEKKGEATPPPASSEGD